MIKTQPDILRKLKPVGRKYQQYEIDDFLLNSKKRWKKEDKGEPVWHLVLGGIALAAIGYVLLCGWLLATNPQ